MLKKILSVLLIFFIFNTTFAKTFNNTGNVGLQPVVGGLNKDNTAGARGKFLNDLFSGSAGYQYKLDFPSGPRGKNLDLALSYNSYSRDSASVYGYGWDLNMSKIYRNSRKGVDKLYSSNEFIADGNELVLINTGGLYQSKSANNLNKYTFLNNKWVVNDSIGNTYVYGSIGDSRISDPSNSTKVFAWVLDYVTDQFGNRVDYTYYHDSIGNVYPKSIKYTYNSQGVSLYEIQFRYIDKTRSIVSYRTQFELKSNKLLSEVALLINNQEVKKYVLSYSGLDSTYSCLTSIQEKAGNDSIPAIKFTYGTGRLINLLTKIENGLGGTIELGYTPSTGYKKSGINQNNKLPLLLMTLSRVDYTDSITGQKSFDQFEYAGGNYYYDSSDLYGREYAGFYKVTQIDDTGKNVVSYFHQSQTSQDGSQIGEYQDHISKKGQIFREETYNGSGALMLLKLTKWGSVAKGNDRFLVNPISVANILYKADGDHVDTAEGYEYDEYGNETKKILYGFVNANINDGTFSDILSDRRDIITSYAINPDKNLYSFPYLTKLLTGSGDIVNQSEKRYDNLSGGLVGSGLVTTDISYIDNTNTITKQYGYDNFGSQISNTDANGNIITLVYDDYHLYPITSTNPLGWQEHYVYNYLNGQIKEVTDINNVKKSVIYDSFGRITSKSVQISNSNPIVLENHIYNTTLQPNQEQVTQYYSQDGTDFSNNYIYKDGFGKTIQTREETSTPNEYSVSKILYDNDGRKLFITYPRIETGSGYISIQPEEKGDFLRYDSFDRIVLKSNYSGDVKYSYDGSRTTLTNQKNISTMFDYNAFGNLNKVIETNSGSQYITSYDYSPMEKLIKITDALGNVRNFSYDGLGRVKEMEDLHPISSTNINKISFTYDGNGNILGKTVQSGENISKVYDSLNRVTTETYPSGTGLVITNFTYDEGDFAKGLLTHVVKGSYGQSYEYNGLGQKTKETIIYGTDIYPFVYNYNLIGDITSITFPDSKVQSNTYQKGLAKSITFDGQPIINNIDYNAAKKSTKTEYGNGIIMDYVYDYNSGYRLLAKRSTKGEKRYQIIGYTFDPVGNIIQLTEQGLPELKKTVTYGYDDLNRLMIDQYVINSDNSTINENFSYNPIGDILSGPAFTTSQYGTSSGANPHAITQADGVVYSYDYRGNLIQKNDQTKTSTYEYNVKNEMTSYTDEKGKVNYEYDTSGRRILKLSGDSVDQYINQFLEIEK